MKRELNTKESVRTVTSNQFILLQQEDSDL